jgi:hypothetical protein
MGVASIHWSLTRANGQPSTIRSVDPKLESYIDSRFRYVLKQIPVKVRSRDDALSSGLNCIALAHLVIADVFGYRLPAELQCVELALDEIDFEEVSSTDELLPGDLIWFGTNAPVVDLTDFVPRYANGDLLNFDEFPINHVGIATGEQEEGDPLVLHASPVDGTNAIWPLGRFSEYPRYGTIYKISRLREGLRNLDR